MNIMEREATPIFIIIIIIPQGLTGFMVVFTTPIFTTLFILIRGAILGTQLDGILV
jgi:hypothetical protein